LSIGDTATFCAVCGARAEPAASTEQTPAPEAREAPVLQATEAPGAPAMQAPEEPAMPATAVAVAQVPDEVEGRPAVAESAPARRRREASLPMLDAERLEKTDPARSAALYREAILGLLEAAADPLEHEGVRRDLLQIFDRLSVVLKREGLPAEALEEIDCAASLGLLDCQDYGIKGHREALKKRRESLRRSLDGHPPAAT
jgi:hypothetical protein